MENESNRVYEDVEKDVERGVSVLCAHLNGSASLDKDCLYKRSRLEYKASQSAIVVHEQICSRLHADIIGISFSNHCVPRWPISLIQRLLDVLSGQLGHIREGSISLDAIDDSIRQFSQHLST